MAAGKVYLEAATGYELLANSSVLQRLEVSEREDQNWLEASGSKLVAKKKAPSTPLHNQRPVTVASFRTWRGWRDWIARDPAPSHFSIG